MDVFKIELVKGNTPKYVQIYKHIKSLIDDETLKASQKLPALRDLSEFLEVNISTAVKAYELLEKERYIFKKEGSGSYVYPHLLSEDDLDHAIRFDLANPKASMFPVSRFKQAVSLAIEKEGESLFDYQEGLGYEPLRARIGQYLTKSGISSDIERIQIISGAQQGINIIASSLLSYKDVVFVEEPSYPGAIEVFKEHGVKVISIPLLDDGIDIGIVKMKLRKNIPAVFYIMPNFHNPTGISYSRKKKHELLALAKEYDFMIIEDDYMSDFAFRSEDHLPLRSYDDSDRVIYIKSFSKILMPGLRIGFMEMPKKIRNLISRTKYSMDISTSSFTQLSLYYYMQYFDWDAHISTIREIYEKRFYLAVDFIDTYFNKAVSFRRTTGGISFFAALPKEYSSLDLKKHLEKSNIKILDGTLFYSDIKTENEFRISIAHMEERNIITNLKKLDEAISEFLSNEKNKIKYKYL